ncbi:MAG TPA: hypothetical protein VFO72_04795, partial [Pyrinomonadaceae bacterium]|nr:hypothetical protein [Pyrinomonadaceae bacterium]
RSADDTVQIEIIDFKTNRIRPTKTVEPAASPYPGPKAPRLPSSTKETQFSFNFEETPSDASMNAALRTTSEDYELQMQSYVLAVRELVPSLSDANIRVTLHFLDPNIEVHLAGELLDPARCAAAVDEAMLRIVSSADPVDFPVKTAAHCRACNFLRLCAAGREFLSSSA